MKKIILLLAILLIPLTTANPIITGILYDPSSTDSGNEWIELYNPTNETINLSTYTLERFNGANKDDYALVWWNSTKTLQSNQFYLIGEENIVQSDENQALKLQNGPDGIRLNKSNTTIELIAWGEQDYAEYKTGIQTQDVSSKVLSRNYTIMDNTLSFSKHFAGVTREPRNTQFDVARLVSLNSTREDITYVLHIPNTKPELDALDIISPDVSQLAGHQIALFSNITVIPDYVDDDGDVTHLRLRIANTLFDELYVLQNRTAAVNLPITIAPGKYQFVASVLDDELESDIALYDFEVMSTIGIDVNTSYLEFKLTDDKFHSQFEVKNSGNQPVTLSFWVDKHFPLQNITYNQSQTTLEPGEISIVDAVVTKDSVLPGIYRGLFRVIANALD